MMITTMHEKSSFSLTAPLFSPDNRFYMFQHVAHTHICTHIYLCTNMHIYTRPQTHTHSEERGRERERVRVCVRVVCVREKNEQGEQHRFDL